MKRKSFRDWERRLTKVKVRARERKPPGWDKGVVFATKRFPPNTPQFATLTDFKVDTLIAEHQGWVEVFPGRKTGILKGLPPDAVDGVREVVPCYFSDHADMTKAVASLSNSDANAIAIEFYFLISSTEHYGSPSYYGNNVQKQVARILAHAYLRHFSLAK